MKGKSSKCGMDLVHLLGPRTELNHCPKCGTLISPEKYKEVQKTGVINCILVCAIAAIIIIIIIIIFYFQYGI